MLTYPLTPHMGDPSLDEVAVEGWLHVCVKGVSNNNSLDVLLLYQLPYCTENGILFAQVENIFVKLGVADECCMCFGDTYLLIRYTNACILPTYIKTKYPSLSVYSFYLFYVVAHLNVCYIYSHIFKICGYNN